MLACPSPAKKRADSQLPSPVELLKSNACAALKYDRPPKINHAKVTSTPSHNSMDIFPTSDMFLYKSIVIRITSVPETAFCCHVSIGTRNEKYCAKPMAPDAITNGA